MLLGGDKAVALKDANWKLKWCESGCSSLASILASKIIWWAFKLNLSGNSYTMKGGPDAEIRGSIF